MSGSRDISIGETSLTEGPPYLIAEVGVNHNGDLGRALELVDIASEAEADAVKFQLFEADSLARRDAPHAEYQAGVSENQYTMLSNLELPRHDFEVIADHARDRGIEFLCTPFSVDAATFLVDVLDVPALKVSSGDLTYTPLLRFLASTGRVLLLSTGMATMDEIRKALADCDGADVVLLHCVSQYPAPIEQANIAAMDQLRELTGDPVGFSDHFLEFAPSIVATALGARLLERHFTTDRSLPGPDHMASMNPDELRAWVVEVRNAYWSLGDGIKSPQRTEQDSRVVARRSLVATEPLPAGTVVAAPHLTALRPADGISPQQIDEVVGMTLKVDVAPGEPLRWSDLEA